MGQIHDVDYAYSSREAALKYHAWTLETSNMKIYPHLCLMDKLKMDSCEVFIEELFQRLNFILKRLAEKHTNPDSLYQSAVCSSPRPGIS